MTAGERRARDTEREEFILLLVNLQERLASGALFVVPNRDAGEVIDDPEVTEMAMAALRRTEALVRGNKAELEQTVEGL